MNVKSVMQEWRTGSAVRAICSEAADKTELNAKSSLIEGERNVNKGFITTNGLPPNIF